MLYDIQIQEENQEKYCATVLLYTLVWFCAYVLLLYKPWAFIHFQETENFLWMNEDDDDDDDDDVDDDDGDDDDNDDDEDGQTGAARLRINNQLAADSFQNLIGFISRRSWWLWGGRDDDDHDEDDDDDGNEDEDDDDDDDDYGNDDIVVGGKWKKYDVGRNDKKKLLWVLGSSSKTHTKQTENAQCLNWKLRRDFFWPK